MFEIYSYMYITQWSMIWLTHLGVNNMVEIMQTYV